MWNCCSMKLLSEGMEVWRALQCGDQGQMSPCCVGGHYVILRLLGHETFSFQVDLACLCLDCKPAGRRVPKSHCGEPLSTYRSIGILVRSEASAMVLLRPHSADSTRLGSRSAQQSLSTKPGFARSLPCISRGQQRRGNGTIVGRFLSAVNKLCSQVFSLG